MKERLYKYAALFIAALALLCGAALASDAGQPAPNVYLSSWIVDGEVRGACVTGCDSSVTAAVIPAEYDGLPVVRIGAEAFKGHHNLVSVVIPDSVTSIASDAFWDCFHLSSITMPVSVVLEGSNPFNWSNRDAERLSVRITPGTNGIGADYTDTYGWTPWACSSYYNHPTTVIIESGVESIGNCMFRGADDIVELIVPESVVSVGDYAFANCNFADGGFISHLDAIGEHAFHDCFSLTSAQVKEGITLIGPETFRACRSLATVVLPNSLETIQSNAFFDCYHLNDITLPVSVALEGGNPFNYSNRDAESLHVHITPGMDGIGADCTDFYGWTPWASASYYNHPTTVTIESGVQSIGNCMFRGCDDIQELIVPESVVSVGDYAFANCNFADGGFISHLDAIGEHAFHDCFSLTSAQVKEGITLIGPETFRACRSLTTVVLPNTLETIHSNAFFDCYHLNDITLPVTVLLESDNPFNYSNRDAESLHVHITPGIDGIGADCTDFYGWTAWFSASYYNHPTTVTIDSGVQSIGNSMFRGCDDIQELIVPESVVSVGDYAFANCNFADGGFISHLDAIGEHAFHDCFSLTSATVKEGIALIGPETFRACRSLTTVVLPNTLEAIQSNAFFDCYSLNDITLPVSVLLESDNPFNYSNRDAAALSVHITPGRDGTGADCTDFYGWTPWASASYYNHPTSVTIESGVQSIGNCMFRGCDDIQEMAVPESVVSAGDYAFANCNFADGGFTAHLDSIGAHAFHGCSNLTSATVKEGIAVLQPETFRACHSLTTVVLPNSLETIQSNAFMDCYSLNDITLPVSVTLESDNPFNYSNRDAERLSVRITPGTGTGADYSAFYGWTPWASASYYNHPVSVTIESGVEVIGNSMFRGGDDITGMNVAGSVSSAGEWAFASCQFANGGFISQLDSIGAHAFHGCSKLSSAAIKEGIAVIKPETFRACRSLQALVLPNSLETIQSNAFFDCYSLNNITMPVSVALESDNPFNYSNRDAAALAVRITPGRDGTGADYRAVYGWTPWASASYYNHPVTIEIEEGVTSIGHSMFRESDDIQRMTFPASMALVDSYATYRTAFTCQYGGTREQWGQIEIRDHNSASLQSVSPVLVQSRTVTIADPDGNALYAASFYGVEDCRVLCAFYNADGRLLGTAIKSAGEEARFTQISADAVRAKALFLDGDSGATPQRAAEIITLG